MGMRSLRNHTPETQRELWLHGADIIRLANPAERGGCGALWGVTGEGRQTSGGGQLVMLDGDGQMSPELWAHHKKYPKRVCGNDQPKEAETIPQNESSA